MLLNKIYKKLRYELNNIQFYFSKRKRKKYTHELSIVDIKKTFSLLNSEYNYFHHYFWNLSPIWLKEHRIYFSKEGRAYGEGAFNAMWYIIFKEFKPKKVLEIGVYRGQTLSLFSLLSQKLDLKSEVHGISPFSPSGDSVSIYLRNIDYLEDVKKNFKYFNLPVAFLHKGFSNDKEMIKIVQSFKWDLIYIDGNHDYVVVKHDFDLCSEHLNLGGLIVLDDASLYVDFEPPSYSSAGHPGPSKVALKINKSEYQEILSVGHNRVFKKLK